MLDSASKNVFLHYLNHDTQEIFQLDKRFYRQHMQSLLLQSLYVSTLMCKDFCFFPLGFLYESTTTRRLLKSVQPFFSEKLIRISLREQDIERYIEKKKKGLLPYKDIPIYSSFFTKNPYGILKDIGAPLIDRETRIGSYCLDQWRRDNENPENSQWKLIYSSIADKSARKQFQKLMLSFPERYAEIPFIWPSVEEHLLTIAPDLKAHIRRIFEKYYYEAYLQEYDASILLDLPFASCDFGLSLKSKPTYSYSLYRYWLHMLSLSGYISLASPEDIIRLKFAPEFIMLNELYLEAAVPFQGADTFQNKLATIIQDKKAGSLVIELRNRIGFDKFTGEVMAKERNKTKKRSPIDGDMSVDIGIVIALKEEFREFFPHIKGSYKTKRDPDIGNFYYLFEHKRLDGLTYKCAATFAGSMGEKKAGLITQQFIRECKPNTVVVLGIAAGISGDVVIGDVVAATQVDSYLDNSKAVSNIDGSGFDYELSGEVYRTSADLVKFIQNFEFINNEAFQSWVQKSGALLYNLVSTSDIYPLILNGILKERPEFVEGHVASGPTVGAAEQFIVWLKSRDRKYLALEMESGGVLGAIYEQVHHVRSMVLRGISDYGDARKKELDRIRGGALRKYAMSNAIGLLWSLLDAGAVPHTERSV